MLFPESRCKITPFQREILSYLFRFLFLFVYNAPMFQFAKCMKHRDRQRFKTIFHYSLFAKLQHFKERFTSYDELGEIRRDKER